MYRLIHTGLLLLLAGCASKQQYLYVPAEEASAIAKGYPAARYVIPEGAPTGDVRVVSFGVTDLDLDGGRAVAALHVRLLFANNTDFISWRVDTRDVRLSFPGQVSQAPAYVNAAARDLPVFTIPAGEQRAVDLYFPLPDRFSGAKDLPGFDIAWRVQTGTRLVIEQTPFERFRIEPKQEVEYTVPPAPYWWYDPLYPRPLIVYGRPLRVYQVR